MVEFIVDCKATSWRDNPDLLSISIIWIAKVAPKPSLAGRRIGISYMNAGEACVEVTVHDVISPVFKFRPRR